MDDSHVGWQLVRQRSDARTRLRLLGLTRALWLEERGVRCGVLNTALEVRVVERVWIRWRQHVRVHRASLLRQRYNSWRSSKLRGIVWDEVPVMVFGS